MNATSTQPSISSTTLSSNTQNLGEITSMIVMGIIGINAALWSLIVVMRNSFLKGLVKHYMLVDLTNVLLVNVCHLFWGVPCAIWSIDAVFPWLNYIIGDLAFTLIVLSYNPKLFLGINRFLAIAFDGRFFGFFERLKYVQYALMIGIPLASYILFMLPGCHELFITHGLNYFWVESDCGEQLNYYVVGLLGYIYLPCTTVIDFTVFFMLHRRIRAFHRDQRHQTSQQKAEKLRKEYRLAVQMVTDLVTGLILNFSVVGFTSFSSSDLAAYILSTFFWQLCSIVSSLSYAILLREGKAKTNTTGGSLQVSSQPKA